MFKDLFKIDLPLATYLWGLLTAWFIVISTIVTPVHMIFWCFVWSIVGGIGLSAIRKNFEE